MASQLINASKRVGRAIETAVEPDGMNLITSAGKAAEQTVFHLHLHLVPRWEDDGFAIWPPKVPMAKGLKQDLAQAVREACPDSEEG